MEEFLFENCEGLMKEIFGRKYPHEEGKSYCKQEVNGKTLADQVWEVLEDLRKTHGGERKRRVIILRFGLEDGRKRTFKEIGLEFYISGERVRQINERTRWQLRHPLRSHQLEPYLESEIAQEAVAKRFQKEEEERKKRKEIERQRRQKEEEERKVYTRFQQPKTLSFEKQQEEIRDLLRTFEKTSIACNAHCPNRFVNKIRRKGFLFLHLKTLSEEESVTILKMPGTQTEQCLRQMWQITNQRASPLD